jgi:acyl-CoA reductase-like NAD-dependent aldehyde dehydrogenase
MKLQYQQITIPIQLDDFEKATVSHLSSKVQELTGIQPSNQVLGKGVESINTSEPEKLLSSLHLTDSDTITLKIQPFDPKDKLFEIVETVRENYKKGLTKPLKYRLEQLHGMKKMMETHEKDFKDALEKDLKSNEMTKLNEIYLSSINEIDTAISNVSTWMIPTSVSLPIGHSPGSGMIMKEPFGLVLLISPWNYPVSLIVKPLVGIISAGNACIVKPSEVSAATSALFAKLIPMYLDTRCYQCIEGGPKETTLLLSVPYDYIFYTGSTSVGKIIMEAASKSLCPVTLELGGKSPCIVLKDCDIDVTAKRLTWGKFFNCGQTCIAPDYILVDKSIQKDLVQKIKEFTLAFYGTDPQKCKEYSRIINQRHTKRLQSLLKGQEIFHGGIVDVDDSYVSPTIVLNPKPDSSLMEDEIFGPILPVIGIENIREAIDFVNRRPKPLALYLFSSNNDAAQYVMEYTSSGAVSVNEVLMHFAINTLPFGGVGGSGMGNYNGKFSFDTFSHAKTVLHKGTSLDPSLRYPPYTPKGLAWLKTLSAPSIGGFFSTLFGN